MFQIIMSAKHGNPQTSTITLNIVLVTYTEEIFELLKYYAFQYRSNQGLPTNYDH